MDSPASMVTEFGSSELGSPSLPSLCGAAGESPPPYSSTDRLSAAHRREVSGFGGGGGWGRITMDSGLG